MYKRPRPILPQVQPLPAVISPTEQVEAKQWQPWVMKPLGGDDAEILSTPAPVIDYEAIKAERLAKELQAIKDAARHEGLALGHEEGYKAGFDKGMAQGHQEGYAAGTAQASEEQKTAANQLVSLAETANQTFEQIHETMGQALVQMGVRIAGQVLKLNLEDTAPTVLATVNEVLSLHEGSDSAVSVFLNVQDLELVKASLAAAHQETQYRLIESPELLRGDVKVKTKFGEIDATLATRWVNAMASIGLSMPISAN